MKLGQLKWLYWPTRPIPPFSWPVIHDSSNVIVPYRRGWGCRRIWVVSYKCQTMANINSSLVLDQTHREFSSTPCVRVCIYKCAQSRDLHGMCRTHGHVKRPRSRQQRQIPIPEVWRRQRKQSLCLQRHLQQIWWIHRWDSPILCSQNQTNINLLSMVSDFYFRYVSPGTVCTGHWLSGKWPQGSGWAVPRGEWQIVWGEGSRYPLGMICNLIIRQNILSRGELAT